MKTFSPRPVGLITLVVSLILAPAASGQSSAFTYQGRLQDGASDARGIFDLRFTLFDAATNGAALGANTLEDFDVTNGLFIVSLDFGPAALDGTPRWLEIAVRTGSSNSNPFATLTPRQALTTSPYAFRAAQFSGDIVASQLPTNVARLDASNQVFAGMVQFTHPSNAFSGIFAGNEARLVNTPPASPGSDSAEVVGGNLRNMGRWGLKQTHTKLRSHMPLHILWLGDSIAPGGFNQAEQRVVLNTLSTLMPRAGSSLQAAGQSYFQVTTNGLGIYGNGPDWIFNHYYMANGAVLTSSSTSNGIPATRAELYYWRSNGFGTLVVETNGGAGWGTLATVSGNNGGAYTAAFMNWTIPRVKSCNIRVTSIGTNVVLGFGLKDLSAGAGWFESALVRGDTQLTDLTSRSNTLHTFLAGIAPDLILVSYLDGPIMTNGLVALEDIARTACPGADIVYLQPPAVLSVPGLLNTITQRLSTEIIGRAYNRPVFDRWLLYYPTNVAAARGFFNDDGVHPTQDGGDFSGAFLMEFLGLSPSFLASYGYTNRVVTDVSGKANLSGGNAFTGTQTIAGNLTVTGYIISLGESSTVALRDQHAPGNQLNIEYDYDAIRFRAGNSGFNDQLVSSNIGGRVFLDASPAFSAGPPTLGNGYRWNVQARTLNTTNLTFTGTPSGSPANPNAPAKWPRITNDGVPYYLPVYQ